MHLFWRCGLSSVVPQGLAVASWQPFHHYCHIWAKMLIEAMEVERGGEHGRRDHRPRRPHFDAWVCNESLSGMAPSSECIGGLVMASVYAVANDTPSQVLNHKPN